MATHALPNNRILFNRSDILKRAWQLYRNAYLFPKYRFRRDGLTWAMKKAWADAKEEARKVELQIVTGNERDTKIAALQAQRLDLIRQPLGMHISDSVARIDADLRQLAA